MNGPTTTCTTEAISYLGGLLGVFEGVSARVATGARVDLLALDRDRLHPVAADGSHIGPSVDERLVIEAIRSGSRQASADGRRLAFPLGRSYCLHICQTSGDAPGLSADPSGQTLASLAAVVVSALQSVVGLRQLIEEASEGIFLADLEGNYVDVNHAGCALLGYSRRELLHKNYADLLAPQESQHVRYEELARGATVRVERRVVRKEGAVIDLALSGCRISGDRYLTLARDITEHRALEAALRESEARWRALTEAAFEAILVHENGKIVEVNATLAEMFGYAPEEMLGMAVQQLIAPEHWPEVRRLIEQGHDRPYETVCVTRDGTRLACEICAKTIAYHGREARVVAGRNISERKRTEQQLQRLVAERRLLASQVLAAQEEQRRAIAEELHQQIGKTLTAMKAAIGQLTVGQPTPGAVRQTASRLEGWVDHMLGVVRGRSHSLRPAVLDDLGLGCAVESLVSEVARRSHIECYAAITIPDALPRDIATALYRIAQEALSSVGQYPEARCCWLELDEEDRAVRLRVEHDGAALSRDELEQDRPLGIAAMRARADAVGGHFTLAPRKEGGLILRVVVPLGQR